eukprot:CAMPEP_0204356624 /NCGR_PEP_ID=MMETSP0469-20131031/35086_1 /ASSEMBLY_ACC=CAM_ASM_000384 /TAXON_ID=2969 /ORGANISM="Oxyrrhis marina" /LENGTH=135 /DNA_ID=CAMNT_0051344113 /DNA_START=172 /DNA_END=575 /DNA_ORIENTATION=-
MPVLALLATVVARPLHDLPELSVRKRVGLRIRQVGAPALLADILPEPLRKTAKLPTPHVGGDVATDLHEGLLPVGPFCKVTLGARGGGVVGGVRPHELTGAGLATAAEPRDSIPLDRRALPAVPAIAQHQRHGLP